MKKQNNSFLLAVIWFVVVTVLLTLPGSLLPKKTWLDKIFFDKWVHISLFAVLNYLWLQFFINVRGKKIRLIITTSLICLLYGIAMEFVQKYFIPNRSFDIWDIVADGIGSAVAGFVVGRYIKK